MKVCQRMDIDVEGDDECKIINELWKDSQQLTHVTIHGREYEWLPFFPLPYTIDGTTNKMSPSLLHLSLTHMTVKPIAESVSTKKPHLHMLPLMPSLLTFILTIVILVISQHHHHYRAFDSFKPLSKDFRASISLHDIEVNWRFSSMAGEHEELDTQWLWPTRWLSLRSLILQGTKEVTKSLLPWISLSSLPSIQHLSLSIDHNIAALFPLPPIPIGDSTTVVDVASSSVTTIRSIALHITEGEVDSLDIIMSRLLSYNYSLLQSLSVTLDEVGMIGDYFGSQLLTRFADHLNHYNNGIGSPLPVVSIWGVDLEPILTNTFKHIEDTNQMISLMGVVGLPNLSCDNERIESRAIWGVLQRIDGPPLHANVSPNGNTLRRR
jgi:hypothetical protein